MGEVPRVSVVIPTYNRAHLIAEAIQSVITQTFQDFEIIIIDDGSLDATKEVIDVFQDNRITYIYQKNRGVAAARNKGIGLSQGEYIALLDSDDAWLPDFLEKSVAKLDENPQAALVCSDLFIYDKNLKEPLYTKWHNSKYDAIDPYDAERYPLKYLLRGGCFISPQATVLRVSILDTIGLFDATLITHEDLELFIRIVRDFPIKLIDNPLVKFRHHGNGLQSRQEQMYKDDITVIERTLAASRLTKLEKRNAKNRLAFAYFLWGWYAFYQNSYRTGWQRLLHALKINPWDKKPYLFVFKFHLVVVRYHIRKDILPRVPARLRARLKPVYYRFIGREGES